MMSAHLAAGCHHGTALRRARVLQGPALHLGTSDLPVTSLVDPNLDRWLTRFERRLSATTAAVRLRVVHRVGVARLSQVRFTSVRACYRLFWLGLRLDH